ncbi:MAG: apolipoprotein N-acyltransferase [Candidatus Electrothrix sp. YB6]
MTGPSSDTDALPLSGPASAGCAAFTAALLLLAMPGPAGGYTGWWPLVFIALVPLLSALARLRPSRGLCTGLLCGLLYNLGLLYWVAPVLQRYGGIHMVVAVAALFVLALYMALYFGLFSLLITWLIARGEKKEAASAILLTAPVVWVGLDVLRGYLLTGFPWMDLGYALYRQPLLIQAADLGGQHLLTFCIVLANGLIYWLFGRLCFPFFSVPAEKRYGAAAAGLVLLCGAGGYSVLRYRQVQQVVSGEGTAVMLSVAAVQGNIEQGEKWAPPLKEETVNRYLALSGQVLAQEKKPELLVWPETALPFYPPREPLMARVREFIQKEKVYLLTGAPYFTVAPEEEKKIAYYNSALLLNHSGKLEARYNKQHLVPFGEYVPLRDYLWFVRPLVELIGDFTPGESVEPLEAGNLRAGVLICFESAFPDIARRETAAGANLLVNMTNDAWYGESSAPHHSWAMTVLRAVENRRGLVRAANTGISGVVEPTGKIRQQTPLFTDEVIHDQLPLLNRQTVFVRGGYRFGSLCLALIPVLLILSAVRRSDRRKSG